MIIRGKSVVLCSSMNESHADGLVAAANHEDIHRMIGAHNFPYPYTRDDALFFIGKNRKSGNEVFAEDFMILFNDKIIGMIGLSDIDRTDRKAHVGYWISPDHRNSGYATESLSLIVDYAKNELNLKRLQTKVLDINTPSLRLLIKNGFTVEGYERDSFLFDGKFHNMFLLAMILS